MQRPELSEADMAKRVATWMEEDGWNVHQEVLANRGQERADIVGTKGGLLRVVEVKKQLSFALIYQGVRWTESANETYLAVPHAKRSDGRSMAFRIAKQNGLGILIVKSLWPIEEGRISAVTIEVEAERRDKINPAILKALRPEHKTHAQAGTNAGGHFTPFKATLQELRAFAGANPGCTLRSALQTITHHYASVNSGVQSLAAVKRDDLLKYGLELKTHDGAVRVYQAEEPQKESA